MQLSLDIKTLNVCKSVKFYKKQVHYALLFKALWILFELKYNKKHRGVMSKPQYHQITVNFNSSTHAALVDSAEKNLRTLRSEIIKIIRLFKSGEITVPIGDLTIPRRRNMQLTENVTVKLKMEDYEYMLEMAQNHIVGVSSMVRNLVVFYLNQESGYSE